MSSRFVDKFGVPKIPDENTFTRSELNATLRANTPEEGEYEEAGEGGEAVTGTGASSSSAWVPGEDQPKISGSTLSAGDGSPSTKGGGGKLTDI